MKDVMQLHPLQFVMPIQVLQELSLHLTVGRLEYAYPARRTVSIVGVLLYYYSITFKPICGQGKHLSNISLFILKVEVRQETAVLLEHVPVTNVFLMVIAMYVDHPPMKDVGIHPQHVYLHSQEALQLVMPITQWRELKLYLTVLKLEYALLDKAVGIIPFYYSITYQSWYSNIFIYQVIIFKHNFVQIVDGITVEDESTSSKYFSSLTWLSTGQFLCMQSYSS